MEYSLLHTRTLLAKTLLVKHVVCFVKDKNLHMLRVDKSPADHVHDSSRCSDENVGVILLATLCGVGHRGH